MREDDAGYGRAARGRDQLALLNCNDGQHITLTGTFQRSSSQTPAPCSAADNPQGIFTGPGIRDAPMQVWPCICKIPVEGSAYETATVAGRSRHFGRGCGYRHGRSGSCRAAATASAAAGLYITMRTVSSHLDRVRDKTGCRRRADLTRLALRTGLVLLRDRPRRLTASLPQRHCWRVPEAAAGRCGWFHPCRGRAGRLNLESTRAL